MQTLSTSKSRLILNYYIGYYYIGRGLNFWIMVTKTSIIDTKTEITILTSYKFMQTFLFGVCRRKDWKWRGGGGGGGVGGGGGGVGGGCGDV